MRQLLAITTFTTLLSFAAAADDGVVGLRWRDAPELSALVEAGVSLRYVAPGMLLIRPDEHSTAEHSAADLTARGYDVILNDRATAEEAYFITDHWDDASLEGIASSSVSLVYTDPSAGWSLLRLPLARFSEIQDELFFLWPLPEVYDSRGLLPPAVAKPLAREPAPAVADLISQVEASRLQAHVEALALIDADGGSVLGNVRTRFAFRSETFESTTYIRDQLASALGTDAVSLQEFPGKPTQVSSRVGEFDPAADAIPMYNVVGELEGSDPEAGYYIICAHYDAIGTRSTGGWDWRRDPAPGADDNATGVALVLESARVLSTKQFPWSIRFIAWSGEELGLWGSQHYADLARSEEDRILGVLNFDMIGFNDLSERLELVGNPASEWLVELLRATNERYDIGLQVDVLKDRNAGLSDHAPFWARGYDAILGIENYLPTDPSTVGVIAGDYRLNSQYHSVVDLPDSVNWELVTQVTRLTIASLAQFGAENDLPNLVVFDGDVRGDQQDDLQIRVGNIGPVPVETPYRVVVSRCDADSANCVAFFDAERDGSIAAGGIDHITVEWQRYGESVFHVAVDPDNRIDELEEGDNNSFQSLRLTPKSGIVVFPNPFSLSADAFLSFSGLPLFSKLRITTLDGQLVWSAAEAEQGSLTREIRWRGINDSGFSVGGGLYVYSILTNSGELLERNKIAVLR